MHAHVPADTIRAADAGDKRCLEKWGQNNFCIVNCLDQSRQRYRDKRSVLDCLLWSRQLHPGEEKRRREAADAHCLLPLSLVSAHYSYGATSALLSPI